MSVSAKLSLKCRTLQSMHLLLARAPDGQTCLSCSNNIEFRLRAPSTSVCNASEWNRQFCQRLLQLHTSHVGRRTCTRRSSRTHLGSAQQRFVRSQHPELQAPYWTRCIPTVPPADDIHSVQRHTDMNQRSGVTSMSRAMDPPSCAVSGCASSTRFVYARLTTCMGAPPGTPNT
jgi:hypothetical protein